MPVKPVGVEPGEARPPVGGDGALPLWLIDGRLWEVGPEGRLLPYKAPVRPWFGYMPVLAEPALSANPIADALKAMTLGLKAAWKATKHQQPLAVRMVPVGLILQIIAWVLPFLIAWWQNRPRELAQVMAADSREIPPAMYAAANAGEDWV